MKELTLGSLFSGSGGFELGGILAGIKPLWNSEIEPFPIRVTKKRLPTVKHYGDINKLDGGRLEPVDVITFGSPCTDMSIAGKRDGLDGKQSSLFYQAIRIVKEMRKKTDGLYPGFIVWENVKGAFSSNGGEDFRTVLEEICRIREPGISVPGCAGWKRAGLIMGGGYSVAWRTFDAQYWGVPQRRERIYLVADFTGGRAGEILFESEGLSGYSPQGLRAWQEAAGCAGSGAQAAGCLCLNDQGGQYMRVTRGRTNTLRAEAHHPPLVLHGGGDVFDNHGKDVRYTGPISVNSTITRYYGTGGNNQPLVVNKAADGQPPEIPPEKPTEDVRTFDVRQSSDGTINRRTHAYETDTSRTVDRTGNVPGSNHGGVAVVELAWSASKNSHFTSPMKEKAGALVATDYKDPPVVSKDRCVRRLTPVECARLQGFPDWWCAGLEEKEPPESELAFWRDVFAEWQEACGKAVRLKSDAQLKKWLGGPGTDAAQYKMWGNGVALPCVYFVLSGIAWAAGKE